MGASSEDRVGRLPSDICREKPELEDPGGFFASFLLSAPEAEAIT